MMLIATSISVFVQLFRNFPTRLEPEPVSSTECGIICSRAAGLCHLVGAALLLVSDDVVSRIVSVLIGWVIVSRWGILET